MKIQVIIPVINLWEKYTKQCIDSVKSKNHELRILLIDNASTDETSREAGAMVSSTFSHKRNEERWSVSKSWNYGIKDAWERGFDYVLVLNNDILLNPDCIDNLVDRFEKDVKGKDGLAWARQPGDIVLVSAMDVRGECKEPQNVLAIDSKTVTAEEAPHPNYSCYMINKKCWDIVGEFDEGFFPAYYEDNDHHRRIKLAGLQAIVYPPALFYHYGSRTQNEALEKPIVDSSNTERYFISKWGGKPDTEGLYTTPLNNPANTIKSVKQNNYENK